MLIGKNPPSSREREALIVERHVARLRNGARHQFLAGAGRAGDERGELAHARVQRAPVAADIVREDGLPDGGAQPRGRHRAADDIAEDLLESALDLAEACERVAGLVARRKAHAVDLEEVAPIGQEVVVEAPACGIRLFASRRRTRPRRTAGNNADRAGAGRRLRITPGRARGRPCPRAAGTAAAQPAFPDAPRYAIHWRAAVQDRGHAGSRPARPQRRHHPAPRARTRPVRAGTGWHRQAGRQRPGRRAPAEKGRASVRLLYRLTVAQLQLEPREKPWACADPLRRRRCCSRSRCSRTARSSGGSCKAR